MARRRLIVAVTGTTGVELGLRLIGVLSVEHEVHVVFSESALPIMADEAGFNTGGKIKDELLKFLKNRYSMDVNKDNLTVHPNSNLWSPLSSGSFRTDGMFIVPCSMKTLSAVSAGYASALIERAADVTIKEGRPLVICPRETPLSAIHLENMLRLARIGVRIVPPVIGAYHGRRDMEGMIDFIVGKLLDQMGIDNDLYNRWKGRG
ncbi:MAG: UbiX family flavin prenyltransferase [Nitrospirae bacterium]|nr:MAG: UbiX family flavin prenyltransferase [Nitrospirota bacterium]